MCVCESVSVCVTPLRMDKGVPAAPALGEFSRCCQRTRDKPRNQRDMPPCLALHVVVTAGAYARARPVEKNMYVGS